MGSGRVSEIGYPGEYREGRNPGEYRKYGIRASIENGESGRVPKMGNLGEYRER